MYRPKAFVKTMRNRKGSSSTSQEMYANLQRIQRQTGPLFPELETAEILT